MYGVIKSMTSSAEQIQKAPLSLSGLKRRDSSMPMVKGKSMRSNPLQKPASCMVQPTPRLP